MSASLEIHTNFVRSTVRRVLRRAWPGERALPPVCVKVLSGLQAGSKATFEGPTITVGPDPDFDVMLIDDDLADSWLIVSLKQSVFGPLASVEAHDEDVSVAGTPLAVAFPSEPVSLPCRIRVGEVELEIVDASEARPSLYQRAVMLVIPLLLSVGLAVLGYLMLREYETRAPVELAAASDELISPQPRDLAGSASVVTDILDTSGLRQFLSVRADPADSAVYVSGTLPAQMMSQWQQARTAIDSLMLDEVVITKVVPSAAISGLPAVAAVRLGSDPQVILANGLKIAVGEPIKDDWLVEAVTRNQMTLRRDTETVEIKF